MRVIPRSGRWTLGAVATSAVLAAALAIPIASQSTAVPAQAATSTVLATFSTPGFFAWTVPAGRTTVTFTAFGASGSNVADGNVLVAAGGQGGEARGRFAVRGGEIVEVRVGGSGDFAANAGFNGGGAGATGYGGGASDVRIGGQANGCAKQLSCQLIDRIIVAGGGGSAGLSGDGGAGGGARGGAGGGRGGVQELNLIDAGCIFESAAAFGCGENAGNTSRGAGGGGWFGGSTADTDGGGGGGGSGYVSPGALAASFPTGTHGGDGRVVITAP